MLSTIKMFDKVEGIIKITSENIKTGIITEFPKTHNLITESFRRYYMQSTYSSKMFDSPYLRCGSGTAEPSATDKALTNDYGKNWYGTYGGFSPVRKKCKIINFNKLEVTFTYIIPADSSHIGTLSEIGLYLTESYHYKNSNNQWATAQAILTHSLLKDAEGNPYVIDKTDLDQITVEYRISISSNNIPLIFSIMYMKTAISADSSGYTILKDKFGQLYNIGFWNDGITGGVEALRKHHGIKLIGKYLYGSLGYDDGPIRNHPYWDNIYYTETGHSSAPTNKNTYQECCDDQGHFTIPARRIPVNWDKNKHYILGFLFTGTESPFRIPIYDKNLLGFTIQHLQDYAVGIGDGETTEFRPPLNYWKENTEKIYIDGVLQTRNVDYTCDSHNNVDNLAELLPLHHATVIDAEWIDVTKDRYNYLSYDNRQFQTNEAYYEGNYGFRFDVDPLIEFDGHDSSSVTRLERYPTVETFRRETELYWAGSSGEAYSEYNNVKMGIFSTVKPYIFELPIDDIDIPWDVNSVYLYCKSSSNFLTFSVFYSNDKENWTQVCDHVTGYKPNRPNSDKEPHYQPLNQWCEYSIGADITARYWKLQLHYEPTTPSQKYISLDDDYYMGFAIKHKGNNIRFTNPPAANSVITMDADTDIIYKDENTVIDIGATFAM